MNKRVFFLFLCLIPLSCGSQEYSVKKVVSTNPEQPEQVYIFPMLLGPDKNITHKINRYLVSHQLGIELGKEQTSIFENIWHSSEQPLSHINNLSYTINLLNNKLYAVTISGEFCSAYCEGYDITYTFDLTTGDVIPLDLFFSEYGQKILLNKLNSFKETILNEKIAELKERIESNRLDDELREYSKLMLELYENCNRDHASLSDFRYIPSDDTLDIFYGRCSAHFNRSIDELWYFNTTISINEWYQYLSDLGMKKFNL